MKIIISPAKKMKYMGDDLAPEKLPAFLEETERLRGWLCGLTYPEAKQLWGCSEKIAKENYERLKVMDLRRNLSPAILAYDGIQYEYMKPAVFSDRELSYIKEHLRILSGFYGVLEPMDGVTPYRLEMQARVSVDGVEDLYDYWGGKLYDKVLDESETIINLASKEYSKCISSYLKLEDNFITCTFAEAEKGKLVQKGVYVKMARGGMVRYMAENCIEDPEGIKGFSQDGYEFREELSTETEYVFVRKKN